MREKRTSKLLNFLRDVNSEKTYTILSWITIVCVISLIGYIAYFNSFVAEENDFTQVKCAQYNEGWVQVFGDGSVVPADIPFRVKNDGYEKAVVENVLPDNITDKDYLAFRTKAQLVDVYIGNELRKSTSMSSGQPYRTDVPSRYVFVPVSSSDKGKTVHIEGYRYTAGHHGISDVYIGERASINSKYILTNSVSLIFAILFFFISLECIIIGSFFAVKAKSHLRVDLMGWCLFVVALWNVTQSDFRDFMFYNIKAISLVPPIALLILPILLAMFLNFLQGRRYGRLYIIYCAVDVLYFAVRLILQVFHISDFYEGLTGVFVILFLLVPIIVFTIHRDNKNGYSEEYSYCVWGLYFLAVCGVAQMFVFAFAKNSDATALCLGFAVLTVISFVHEINGISRRDADATAALLAADIKNRFLANMSHEIRTPITAVLGMNEAILKESKEEKILAYASDVDSSGHMLLSLINDILDFSKLDSGNMSLVTEEYGLRSLIIDCYSLIKGRAENKNLEIELEIDQYLPSRLCGDEIRIKQILVNLLTNAVKYTDSGKIGIRVFGEWLNKDEILIKFHVFDTGRGIKNEDINKLFDAFKRVDEVRNKDIEGTGLGLAITSSLVKLMNGTLEIESVYGEGSVFKVHIPQLIISRRPIGVMTVDQTNSQTSIARKKDYFTAPDCRVLVVDDVMTNLKVAQNLLGNTKMQVDCAKSGDMCIGMCKAIKYDVILLDHMMPGKDGIQTLKELKADKTHRNQDTPIIALTANAVAGAREEYLDNGFDDYLSKPFSSATIQKMVMKYLPEGSYEVIE